MKIGISDGTIWFERGSLTPKLSRMRFLESAIGRAAKESLVNDDWRHYDIDPEDGIAGTLIYKGDKLERIFLAMKMIIDKSEDWTVEAELKRKDLHDRFLREQLGDPPHHFEWGRVVSTFDPKGLASEIIVVYGC
jgi:hypothetical protein